MHESLPILPLVLRALSGPHTTCAHAGDSYHQLSWRNDWVRRNVSRSEHRPGETLRHSLCNSGTFVALGMLLPMQVADRCSVQGQPDMQ
jgi:hypothetical protein